MGQFKVGDKVKVRGGNGAVFEIAAEVDSYRLSGVGKVYAHYELYAVEDELEGYKVGDIVLYRPNSPVEQRDFGIVEELDFGTHQVAVRWLKDRATIKHAPAFLREYTTKG